MNSHPNPNTYGVWEMDGVSTDEIKSTEAQRTLLAKPALDAFDKGLDLKRKPAREKSFFGIVNQNIRQIELSEKVLKVSYLADAKNEDFLRDHSFRIIHWSTNNLFQASFDGGSKPDLVFTFKVSDDTLVLHLVKDKEPMKNVAFTFCKIK